MQMATPSAYSSDADNVPEGFTESIQSEQLPFAAQWGEGGAGGLCQPLSFEIPMIKKTKIMGM